MNLRYPRLLLVFLALAIALGTLVPIAAADQSAPLIAVLPFDDGQLKHWWWNDWDVGKGISDMMVNELLNLGKFRLVEREKIAQIIEEQNFGASGRVDNRTAAQIGKILGIRFIVMGKVTEFTVDDKGGALGGIGIKVSTARVALDGRLVNTTSAEIVAGAKGTGESKQTGLSLSISSFPHIEFGAARFEETILGKATKTAIKEFCADLTDKYYQNAGASSAATTITGKVALVSGNKITLNIGTYDGVTVGMVFVITKKGETITDPDTGEVLGQEEGPPVCEIVIDKVSGDHLSSGNITALRNGGLKVEKGDIATKK